jgi:acylphosphatase
MDNIRLHLIIEGRVQGVFFRDSTRRQAQSLGVTGWVRNLRNGNVEVVAEGPEDRVRPFADWCRRGPSAARVERVQEDQEAWTGEFDSFDVTF